MYAHALSGVFCANFVDRYILCYRSWLFSIIFSLQSLTKWWISSRENQNIYYCWNETVHCTFSTSCYYCCRRHRHRHYILWFIYLVCGTYILHTHIFHDDFNYILLWIWINLCGFSLFLSCAFLTLSLSLSHSLIFHSLE